MPRVHKQIARKDYPDAGIKKGDEYYKWKFRYGGTRMSKTPPTRQQLTQSDFLISLYDIEDEIGQLSEDSVVDDLPNIIDNIRTLSEEQEDKRSNMPDGLQDGEVGELLQERADELSSWADELEGIELEVDEDTMKDEAFEAEEQDMMDDDGACPDDDEYLDAVNDRIEEAKQEAVRNILEEVQNCSHNL